MDNSEFSEKFRLAQYIRDTNYHTDNGSGTNSFNFFGYMLKGHARLVSDGIDLTVNTGELMFIPRHLPYHSYWYGEPTVQFISLGFEVFPDSENRRFILQKMQVDDELHRFITAIPLDDPVSAAAAGMVYTLLGRLLPEMEYRRQKSSDSVVGRAIKYIGRAPHASVNDIARYLGISESGLYAAFRKEGTTPVEAKQKILCERAAALLHHTDMTVEDIADRLGFGTPSYFRRVLKKQLGKTPAQIRKELPL